MVLLESVEVNKYDLKESIVYSIFFHYCYTFFSLNNSLILVFTLETLSKTLGGF